MDVTFETTQGFRFTVEIWYFATVLAMKEQVSRHAGIPVKFQRLFFHGRELEDDRDVEHYSILQGSHVLIVISDGGGSGAVVVHVVASVLDGALGGGAVAVDVDASFTIARLKEVLQELSAGALPAAQVSVYFEEAEMEDGETLAEYLDPPPPATDEGATMEVRVAVRQPAAPPVAVATASTQPPKRRLLVEVKWGAGTAMVEVSETVAVRQLRAELGTAAAHLLVPDYGGGYFFIHKENVMMEDRTLQWHDVQTGDTIEIVDARDFTGGGGGARSTTDA